MKEKILQKIKSAVGQTSATTDITLNKWADYLSARITEETQIDAEIETIKPLIETYDGNLNFIVAREVNKVKSTAQQTTQQSQQTQQQSQQTTEGEPAWFTAFKQKQAEETEALKNTLGAFQKEKTTEAMVSEAKNAFYKKYRISEQEKALCEKALNLELKLNAHEKTDTLIEGWKAQYEELRSMSGLGGVEPFESKNDNGKKEKPMINSLKQQLIREGKLPKVETT